jgi:hypothetical protein
MRAILLLAALIPTVSFGWGSTGHKTVCQIAYMEISASTRTQVDRLIRRDPDFSNFAESCLFADGPPRIRAIDHYVNVPRSNTAITQGNCPMAETCLFTAISSDAAVLGDAESSQADKLLALKLLGHWVGDMHQPLHVSYQDDRGGNFVDKKDDPDGGNIHSVWDFDIIEQRIGSNYSHIATELRKQITAHERASWGFDSPVEWANESYQITISATTEYCTRQRGSCWYAADNMMVDAGEPHREINVSEEYLSTNQPFVERRLKQAGVRLAELLDNALQ